MPVIKHTKENMFVVPLSISSGGSTSTVQFQCQSASDGGVVDLIIGGKTECATT